MSTTARLPCEGVDDQAMLPRRSDEIGMARDFISRPLGSSLVECAQERAEEANHAAIPDG
jgi:hypothetical protein